VSRIGYHPSAETRAKIGAASRGRYHSAETRAKMSASHKGRKFTPEHRAKISAALKGRPDYVGLASVKGECVYCGRPGTTYDHVIPRFRPGWDTPDNVVPCCRSCNTSKSNRSPEEWWAAMVAP